MEGAINVTLLSATSDLVAETIAKLTAPPPTAAGHDYSANLVIFPGKRPAHFLRKTLGERIGGSFIPPRVFSMDSFVDFIYEDALGLFAPAIEGIDAVAILYRCHREGAQNISYWPSCPTTRNWEHFVTPDSFFGIGMSIYRDIEELCIEKKGIDITARVEEIFKEQCPLHSMQNIQRLSFFYEEFYKTVKALNYSTRSLRYATVSEKIMDADLSRYDKIIVAGFYGLTTSEIDLFNGLGNNTNAEFIFQDGPGIHERLKAIGFNDITPIAKDTTEPRIEFYRSPDTHGQVFAFNSLLAKQQNLNERTVIALPSSETLFPLLLQGLSVFDDADYNVSLGYPLYRTPIYGFFNNLMQLITSMDGNRLYIHDYLRFVLHPYTKNILIGARADVTRIMFHTIEEELSPNRTKTFFSLDELEDDTELFDAIAKILRNSSDINDSNDVKDINAHLINIHQNTIRRFMAFTDTADFATQCIAVLSYIYKGSTAPIHPYFYPFAEAFVTTLYKIANSQMAEIRFMQPAGYFNLFKKYIATCYCPFTGTPLKGMQVLGFLETRNIQFDRVYILDVNEGVLPGANLDDSLLPFSARQQLGLPTALDREKSSAYYLETLIAGAKEVAIFFVENDKKEKSRFVERLLWKKQRRNNSLNDDTLVRAIQYRIELMNSAPAPVPKTDVMLALLRDNIRYSASALESYLVCPLRFYYKYVLRLDKKDKAAQDIEPLDIGSFVHHVLAQYFRRLVEVPLTPEHIDQAYMISCVEVAFSEFYGQDPSGAAYLLRRQVRRHLLDFLSGYTLPIVASTKTVIKCVEEAVSVRMGRFRLYGVLDRVDVRDGAVLILDYKTSARIHMSLGKLDLDDRDSWSAVSNCVQLPFYRMLYAQRFGIPPESLSCAHIFLGRSVIDEGIEVPFPPEFYGIIEGLIHRVLGEIVEPSIPFESAGDVKTACLSCVYRCICST
ncbi:MAG: PD-(D/E)XK nuclease family protein [Nitrospirae bacterium]|nr:PD-(D/E)XK nuclease family protein [Nitrospirota bacterium]